MIHPRRLRPFMKPILVLQEILQGNSTAVLVSGYSHRWHVGTKENINRTTLLLQDAIGWAIRNVLPHISEILYPDSMSKSEKKKNFAENCLVCTLLNRIVNCLPGDKILESLVSGTKATVTSRYLKTTVSNNSCHQASYTSSQRRLAIHLIAYPS
jgi:hypothetical protein